MSGRGRPPKPTSLKILTGNPGQRPLNSREPQPTATPPKCPAFLAAAAKAKWRELAPELAALGLLTSVDGGSFACLCEAWAEFLAATRKIHQAGRFIVAKRTGHIYPHPAVAMQRSAWKSYKEFSALFGLDPSARSRLHMPEPISDDDPLEAMLNGRSG